MKPDVIVHSFHKMCKFALKILKVCRHYLHLCRPVNTLIYALSHIKHFSQHINTKGNHSENLNQVVVYFISIKQLPEKRSAAWRLSCFII